MSIKKALGFLILVVFVALSGIGTIPKRALACSCVVSGTPQEEAKDALVFTGRVTKIKEGNTEHLVTFQIYEWMKEFGGMGDGKTFSVNTASNSAACGYTFEEGEDYLVYARGRTQSDAFEVSLCSRTALLTNAAEDLDALGFTANGLGRDTGSSTPTRTPATTTLEAPLVSTSSTSTGGSATGTIIAIIILIVAAALAGIGMVRSKKQSMGA